MNENTLLKSRENMYRFLSRLYLLEVDEKLLDTLCGMKFPKECFQEDMNEGYERMSSYLQECKNRLETEKGSAEEKSAAAAKVGEAAEGEAAEGSSVSQEILDDLAVDYARIFLSAGVAQGKAAFPYESVYTSRQHLMMQESQGDVAALFAKRGLEVRKDTYRMPEDHLGLLLEYMAILCKEGQQKEQQDFLRNHLLNWIFAFTADMIKYASTDFYRGLGKLTKGFLSMERSLLADM